MTPLLQRSRRALVTAAVLALGLGGLATVAAPTGAAAAPSGTPASSTPYHPGHVSPTDFSWKLTATGSTARLRGLSAVSSQVAWASGTEGTVLRTTDGGRTWQSVGPPGTEALQFRDIEATSARHAVIMSIGDTVDAFRLYVTDNGGATWTETFRNTEPTAFYDCMAFVTPSRGVAVSDPVDGKFRVIETRNAGRSWSIVDPAGMPAAKDGEFAFAASGTCVTATLGKLWLASGGVNPGRVFRSNDLGHRWAVTDTPVAGGPTAGIFSVRFRDWFTGIIVGGDYTVLAGDVANAAYSRDGGRTWQAARTNPGGFRSGSAWVGFSNVALAVGPSGSDVSLDAGRSWAGFDTGTFDSVECTAFGACWASGEQGRVATLAVSH